MNPDSSVFIAGHRGLVGSALVRKFQAEGYKNLLLRTRAELDLRDANAVDHFFATHKPEIVIIAAAKVGGIHANMDQPVQFLEENVEIQINLIRNAYRHKAKRLLFLGSSCIYPKNSPQPIKEEYLLNSPFEATNEAYAIAKTMGVKLCEYYNKQYGTQYFSVLPCNLYGPNDSYDLHTSHALPALIRKFHEAKENKMPSVEVWGSGKPRREFLYIDDLADGCFVALQANHAYARINIGAGTDISIAELAQTIASVIGYAGEIVYNTTKPDGVFQKLMDVSRIQSLGWKPNRTLAEGIQKTHAAYIEALKKGTAKT